MLLSHLPEMFPLLLRVTMVSEEVSLGVTQPLVPGLSLPSHSSLSQGSDDAL